MKTVSPDVPSPRIVLFGIRCRFTETVARRLTEQGRQPAALILPGPRIITEPLRVAPLSPTLPLASAAVDVATHAVETYQVGSLNSPATIDLIERLSPDIIVVACYPTLIPSALHRLARFGAVNIHPSLLPAHRGPDPLFWIMRDGGAGCGVTVHALSDRFDTGPILAQQPVPYPDGARERELEDHLARAGADMIPDVVDCLSADTVAGIAQDEQRASYESWPSDSDYLIDTNRPARHAWNFVRGVAERGVPVGVETDRGTIYVFDAVAFGADDQPVPSAEQVVLRFSPGWLLATRAPAPGR